MQPIKENKDIIRRALFRKLMNKKVFWSYSGIKYESVKDDILIQKVLEELEMEDIRKLFSIYTSKKIKKVWKEKLVKQDPYYRGLNLMMGKVFFNIKKPEEYIFEVKNKKNPH